MKISVKYMVEIPNKKFRSYLKHLQEEYPAMSSVELKNIIKSSMVQKGMDTVLDVIDDVYEGNPNGGTFPGIKEVE